MKSMTTKVKNGSLELPKEIEQAWNNAEVFVIPSQDSLFVKRMSKSTLSLSHMLEKFRKAAKNTKLKKKDVEETIRSVRRNK